MLGAWLATQRSLRRGNIKGERLFPHRQERLQALVDMEMLSWEYPKDDKWGDKFNLLLKYGEEHGTCNVPQSERNSPVFILISFHLAIVVLVSYFLHECFHSDLLVCVR